MTGLRTRLSTTMGRIGVGMVASAAAALLVMPTAWATPDTDADAAITAAWDVGGGPTGPLGIKDGGVYPVAAGFGQNFAGGKIFFTPDTGAHAMRGAILDEYQSLGGPADSDLGFPTIDEGDGKAPGSRNTTFSAADRPVIFWTPDTGARVVRGSINAAWDQLGGSAGTLGVPTEDEAYSGDDVSQVFSGGQITWDRRTKTFTTTPPELAEQLAGLDVPGDVTTAIAAARRAAGGPLGPLGAADGGQYAIGADGAGQNFAGGKIFYSPATGANVLTGQVLTKYESVGGPQGDLGFPTSNANDGGIAPTSQIATFAAADQPAIFWTPDFGAVIVRGAMNAAWSKLGGATGDLGAPTADQTVNGDVVTQKFNGGAISWDKTTNDFTTEPPALASQLTGLDVPGGDAPQAPAAAAPAAGDGGSKWYTPSWWWLLVIVPLLILIGVPTVAMLLKRRRTEHRGPLDGFDDDDYDDDDERDDYDDDQYDDDQYDEDTGRRHDPEFDSGPVPVADVVRSDVVRSDWAMPGERPGSAEVGMKGAPEGHLADLTTDQDAIDTAPTRIVSEDEPKSLWFSDLDESPPDEPDDRPEREPEVDPEPDSGPPSGRHAAIHLEDPATAETSLRLATTESSAPPAGYPIKADTRTGLYWMPGSEHYDEARAEIWFASEEFALTNGFARG